MSPRCLVTGASGGFGAEFARAFARRSYDLCLVARRAERLEALKAELESAWGVRVDLIVADLARPEGLGAVRSYLADHPLDVLVNNAGVDHFFLPADAEVDAELAMLDLNVRAAHVLVRACLPGMLARNAGRILNVGSLAGCFPVPWSAAYGGTKAYLNNFSLALDHELRTTGSAVRCAIVMPGPLNTDIAGKDYYIPDQGRPIGPYIEAVVRRFLSGRTLICLGPDRAIRLAMGLLPRSLGLRLVYASMRRTYLPRAQGSP